MLSILMTVRALILARLDLIHSVQTLADMYGRDGLNNVPIEYALRLLLVHIVQNATDG